eukprot:Gb_22428 [translate_table: standard]
MDACHLLLGRPLQYDRSVIHDGKENTYEVRLNSKRHILKPLKEEGNPNVSYVSLITLGWKRLLKDTKSEVWYLLYPREERVPEKK